MESILYFLYTEEKEDTYEEFQNDRIAITIYKHNPSNFLGGLLGKRFTIVYCDKNFKGFINSYYNCEIVDIVARSSNIGKREFYFI